MKWAAMQFLLAATRSSTNQAKIKQLLILLFRVMAVLALVLFLSRPLAGGWLGWALATAPDTILVLLDRSSSMEARVDQGGESARVNVLRGLSEAAREYEGASQMFLIESVGRVPQPLARASDLMTVSGTGSSDAGADIPGMLQAALTWLVDNKAGTAEIWIGSDLQRTSWRPDDERWKTLMGSFEALAQKVRFRVLSPKGASTPNTWVSVSECFRRRRGDQSDLLIALELGQNQVEKRTLSLTALIDGAATQIEIPIETQSLRYRTTIPLGDKRSGGWGRISLAADGNPSDNAAFFVYGEERTNHVLVSAMDRSVGQYLALGFQALSGQESIDVRLRGGGGGALRLEDCSVVCWQGSLPDGVEAARLQSWIEEGGVAFFFPPGLTDSRSFLGMGWGSVQSAAREEGYGFARWSEEGGLFARSDEGMSLALKRLEVRRRQLVVGEKSNLVSYEDGESFVVRRATGKGQVFFCSTLPNPEWSSLGDGTVWVPLCHRLVLAGGQRFTQRAMLECGELTASELGGQWATVTSTGQGGIQSSAGIYRDTARVVAVNRPQTEGLIEALGEEDLPRLFAPLSVQGVVRDRVGEGQRLQGELWRALVLCMLGAMLVEGLLVLPRGDSRLDESDGIPARGRDRK